LFFKKENPEKSYENQRLKIAQSLVIGHYNYFYEKNRGLAKLPRWETAKLTQYFVPY